jgi:hypothetical protein
MPTISIFSRRPLAICHLPQGHSGKEEGGKKGDDLLIKKLGSLIPELSKQKAHALSRKR